jgi:regulator of sigma E protease
VIGGFLEGAFWFVLVLGVLVTFHEFGHFWVARRFGIRVLRFSVGFGRPLWSRIARDGTRWQVAMVPLGGYVQFLDEREQEVPPAERETAFNRKPAWQRMLVVLAGPMANLLLCLLFFWIALQLGVPTVAPVLGETHGLAAEAGLAAGERLVEVDGQPVSSWDGALTPLALAAIDRAPVLVAVQDAHGARRELTLRLDRLPADFNQGDPLAALGLSPDFAADRPIVGRIQPGYPAEGVLQPGDRILRIGDRRISRFTEIPQALPVAAAHGGAVEVEYERAGAHRVARLVPQRDEEKGKSVWRLGIGSALHVTVQKYGPWEAARGAFAEARKQSGEMLRFIARLVTGKASTKNLSGVIGIAQVVHAEAQVGLSRLVLIAGTLSLTLCIMNLLPIPVLDGGHLLYYLIEVVSGRPVGERVLLAGQYAGLLLLAGLIGLAFYNDLARILS